MIWIFIGQLLLYMLDAICFGGLLLVVIFTVMFLYNLIGGLIYSRKCRGCKFYDDCLHYCWLSCLRVEPDKKCVRWKRK